MEIIHKESDLAMLFLKKNIDLFNHRFIKGDLLDICKTFI